MQIAQKARFRQLVHANDCRVASGFPSAPNLVGGKEGAFVHWQLSRDPSQPGATFQFVDCDGHVGRQAG
ncbi:MAG: hypothetical protein WBA67_12910 [Jannaschia sp.]